MKLKITTNQFSLNNSFGKSEENKFKIYWQNCPRCIQKVIIGKGLLLSMIMKNWRMHVYKKYLLLVLCLHNPSDLLQCICKNWGSFFLVLHCSIMPLWKTPQKPTHSGRYWRTDHYSLIHSFFWQWHNTEILSKELNFFWFILLVFSLN